MLLDQKCEWHLSKQQISIIFLLWLNWTFNFINKYHFYKIHKQCGNHFKEMNTLMNESSEIKLEPSLYFRQQHYVFVNILF